MIPLVRRIAAVCALGAALAACGAPRTSQHPAPSPVHPSAHPSASPSAATPAPTLARGPGGLTPVFTKGPNRGKTVALTFDADMTADQGPRAAAGQRFDNPGLIDTLRELNVPATVFMTGRWADEYPEEAQDIGRDPLFEVANHSYSHYSFTGSCYGLPVLPEKRMRSDVERAFTAIRKAGVPRPMPYFRFPGGCYDESALRAISPLGVTAIQWDVVSGDAFSSDADAIVRQVEEGVRPGSVVVMHCTRSAAPATEQAIRAIVPDLRKQGYRFVKVSQMIEASAGRR
ncbi:polysaccharide deacetylase family protein [Streptomyces sp. TP-A0356]|uniref:polysaccharide deacetylase family protein n=1 Tax=Streptomyces sp. TP-A0356 TaxID=1359208 RepID=UPI0006E1FEB0|nr:polysaccharide deacetylase family protein [Streptomyces sp. TP-A0356]